MCFPRHTLASGIANAFKGFQIGCKFETTSLAHHYAAREIQSETMLPRRVEANVPIVREVGALVLSYLDAFVCASFDLVN